MRSKIKGFIGLTILTAVAVAAAYFTNRDGSAISREGELLFGNLLDEVADVRSVVGVHRGESYRLEVKDGRWVVVDRGDYPADHSAVRDLVLGAAALERVEPKTAKPERYAALGVDDPSSASSDAVRFTIGDGDGAVLADFVLGNRDASKRDPSRFEFYIRLPDDPQSWLVEGTLPDKRGAIDWLNDTLMDIPIARVSRVVVEHVDGEVVEVSKKTPADDEFTLHDMPPGTELEEPWRANDIGRGLAELAFEDVVPSGRLPEGAQPAYTAVMWTFDGLRVRLNASRVGEDTFATLDAAFDEAESRDPEPARSDSDPPETDQKILLDPQAVRDEVAELSRLWAGRVYRLPEFKADYFARKGDRLVKPVEVEAPAAPAEPATTGG